MYKGDKIIISAFPCSENVIHSCIGMESTYASNSELMDKGNITYD